MNAKAAPKYYGPKPKRKVKDAIPKNRQAELEALAKFIQDGKLRKCAANESSYTFNLKDIEESAEGIEE